MIWYQPVAKPMQQTKRTIMFIISLITLTLLGGFCLVLSSCVNRDKQAYNAGVTALHQGHSKQAFHLFSSTAENGQPYSQYALGYMYYYGIWIPEDEAKALKWIKKASRAHQPQAIMVIDELKHLPTTPLWLVN